MRIDHHVYIHADLNTPKLDEVLKLVKELVSQGAKMSKELDYLEVTVTEIKGVVASAKALIIGLHDLLTAAGTDPVKLASIRADLKSSADDLSAAVAANTPAA